MEAGALIKQICMCVYPHKATKALLFSLHEVTFLEVPYIAVPYLWKVSNLLELQDCFCESSWNS